VSSHSLLRPPSTFSPSFSIFARAHLPLFSFTPAEGSRSRGFRGWIRGGCETQEEGCSQKEGRAQLQGQGKEGGGGEEEGRESSSPPPTPCLIVPIVHQREREADHAARSDGTETSNFWGRVVQGIEGSGRDERGWRWLHRGEFGSYFLDLKWNSDSPASPALGYQLGNHKRVTVREYKGVTLVDIRGELDRSFLSPPSFGFLLSLNSASFGFSLFRRVLHRQVWRREAWEEGDQLERCPIPAALGVHWADRRPSLIFSLHCCVPVSSSDLDLTTFLSSCV